MSLKQVIVALDYENPDHAYQLVDVLGDRIERYKIGPVLFTRSGTEVLRYLHQRGKKIFVDLKLHDTPNVVGNTLSQLAEMGVELASVHCMGGRKMLTSAARACRGSQLKLLGLTLLTSIDSDEYSDDAVLRLTELAMETRLAGILCSPHEIETIRRKTWKGAVIATPGIRLVGHEVYQDDQVRTASPREALIKGADYLIVGRPITQSSDPLTVVDRLFA